MEKVNPSPDGHGLRAAELPSGPGVRCPRVFFIPILLSLVTRRGLQKCGSRNQTLCKSLYGRTPPSRVLGHGGGGPAAREAEAVAWTVLLTAAPGQAGIDTVDCSGMGAPPAPCRPPRAVRESGQCAGVPQWHLNYAAVNSVSWCGV